MSATVLPLQRAVEDDKTNWKEERSPRFKYLRGLSLRRASESASKSRVHEKDFTIIHHPDRPVRRITEAEIPSEEDCRAYLMRVRKASLADQQLQKRQQEHQYFQPFQSPLHLNPPICNDRHLEPEPQKQLQSPAISKPLPLPPYDEIKNSLDLERLGQSIAPRACGLQVPDSQRAEDGAGTTRSYSPYPFIGEAKQVRLERLDSISVPISPTASQASTSRRSSREWAQPQQIQSGRASPKRVDIRRPSRSAAVSTSAPRQVTLDGKQLLQFHSTRASSQTSITRRQPPLLHSGQSSPKTSFTSQSSCLNSVPVLPAGSPTLTLGPTSQEWASLQTQPGRASPKTVLVRRPSRPRDALNSHPIQPQPIQVRVRQDSASDSPCRLCHVSISEQPGVYQRCEEYSYLGLDQQQSKQARPYPQFHKKYPRPPPIISHSTGGITIVHRLHCSPAYKPESSTISPPPSPRSTSARTVHTVLTVSHPPPSPLSALSTPETPGQNIDANTRSNVYQDNWAGYYFDDGDFDAQQVGKALTTPEVDEFANMI